MELKTIVSELVNDETLHDQLGYLSARWADEKEHEDFRDYENAMKSTIEAHDGVTFIKGTKRPFGAHVIVKEQKLAVFMNKKNGYYNLKCKLV